MESSDETDVNLESPAARNADGMIKLNDQRNGCTIDMSKISENIVGTISFGGAYILTSSGKNGKIIAVISTKNSVERPIKDFINFLASLIFPPPIHCPTTVTTATLSAVPPI